MIYFAKGVWSVYRFILLPVNFQLLYHCLLKRLSFLIVLSLIFAKQMSVDCMFVGLFLSSLFCSTDLFVHDCINIHCLDYLCNKS